MCSFRYRAWLFGDFSDGLTVNRQGHRFQQDAHTVFLRGTEEFDRVCAVEVGQAAQDFTRARLLLPFCIAYRGGAARRGNAAGDLGAIAQDKDGLAFRLAFAQEGGIVATFEDGLDRLEDGGLPGSVGA